MGFCNVTATRGITKSRTSSWYVCLAHCRRKFYEAVPAGRQKKAKLLDILSEEAIPEPKLPTEGELPTWIPAEVGLAYCNRLFYIERGLKDLSPEERKAKRRELETPVWEGFWNWIGTINAAGGSKLAKAVKYALNHRETLMNYLLDGRCEISNNAAERRAKSYAIGRKASLFHASEEGAAASAVIYSIVETAKANHLNVYQYLYMVLVYMPDYQNEPAGIEQSSAMERFYKKTLLRADRHRNDNSRKARTIACLKQQDCQGDSLQYGMLFIAYF
ncbi:MAG: IS66 family transposase [Lachnospiraceae bacterium]